MNITDTITDTFTDTVETAEAAPAKHGARQAAAGRIWARRARLIQGRREDLAVWRRKARSGLTGNHTVPGHVFIYGAAAMQQQQQQQSQCSLSLSFSSNSSKCDHSSNTNQPTNQPTT